MFRGNDGRLYENVWTRHGWKRNEVGTEYPHQCVGCEAVISNLNRCRHSINGVPQTCEKCERKPNEIKRTSARGILALHRHIEARRSTVKEARKPIREIHRDIAVRYIQRFHGSTFTVPTAPDDADIYLRNAFGLTIAKVMPTDRYPKVPKVDDLPF